MKKAGSIAFPVRCKWEPAVTETAGTGFTFDDAADLNAIFIQKNEFLTTFLLFILYNIFAVRRVVA